jgi:glycosyltransferase involved in cell wall biosynthesis
MTPWSAIITDYERREAEAGGLAKADPRAIAEAVAQALELPYERVRDVLSAHWTSKGAG